jgi:hypothetical protein
MPNPAKLLDAARAAEHKISAVDPDEPQFP